MKTLFEKVSIMFKDKDSISYDSTRGIRFEIGASEESVYLKNRNSEDNIANPMYISKAFDRAKEIFMNLPQEPNVLRIDGYFEESILEEVVKDICKIAKMEFPHEQEIKFFKWDEEDDYLVSQVQLYWDLEKIDFNPDFLLEEIIKADIGGHRELASSVYFIDSYNSILFKMYDDRGADLVSKDKELIRPIYEKFNSWILDYDRERIDKIFYSH